MRRMKRILVVASLVLLSIPLLSAVAVAGAVAHSGLVSIDVEDRSSEGVDLFIPVPALMIEGALSIALLFCPEEELEEIRLESAPWIPAVMEVVGTFESLPDATLVEVFDGSERVWVRKVGRNLEVEVEQEELHLEISLPIGTVRRSLGWVLGSSA